MIAPRVLRSLAGPSASPLRFSPFNSSMLVIVRGFSAASDGKAPEKVPVSSPSVHHPVSPSEPPQEEKPKSMMGKLKHMVKKYGFVAVGLYSTLYISQVGVGFLVFVENDNFGFEINDLMEHGRLGQYVPSWLSLSTDSAMTKQHISWLMAWLTTEMAEPVRLPLTLALSPLARRWIDRRFPKKQGEEPPQK